MEKDKFLKTISVMMAIGVLSSFESLLGRSQSAKPGLLSQCSDDPNLAIKFFHVPPNSDIFMHPRVLRVVPANDPRLAKAPITESGYVLYITKDEINSVLRILGDDKFSWSVLDRPRALEEKKFQKDPNDPMQTMRITATCPKGSAETEIPVKEMCKVTKGVERELRSKRALWEWKRYELVQGCPASGYDRNEYPDDRQ